MRITVSVMVLSLATWGAGIRAQAFGFGPRVRSAQPSFHVQGFNSAPVLPALQRRSFDAASDTVLHGPSLYSCPMPVARTDMNDVERMPVARSGPTEPMPIARSGCWNPLDR